MTPQEKLIAFQKLKHKFLNLEAKRLNIKIPSYHTNKDSDDIRSWTDEKLIRSEQFNEKEFKKIQQDFLNKIRITK